MPFLLLNSCDMPPISAANKSHCVQLVNKTFRRALQARYAPAPPAPRRAVDLDRSSSFVAQHGVRPPAPPLSSIHNDWGNNNNNNN